MIEQLIQKIEDREYTVGIIGLGYVGLPLLWTFHKEEMPVIGFDIDEMKTEAITSGTPYIKHLGTEMMQVLSESDHCDATTDFSRLAETDAVLICVPTPLDEKRNPDMEYVEKTCTTIGEQLREGQLVVLESTTYPGTTEDLIIPILESQSGLTAGKDFYLAFSPEREDPGNANFNTSQIPKVVGGHTPEGLQLAKALYDVAIVETVPVSDTKTAEAVKITENVFRAVNIALVNELKLIYHKMGIDVHEVLDAADTKPFGFMKFVPGPGLGGHCIPIDPFYLTWKAREYDQNTRFIELAGEINTAMPRYVIDQTIKALNAHKKPVNGSKILVIGLAYKPDVDDMRESPTFPIMDLLKEYGAEISYYDSHIPVIPPSRDHKEWTGTESIIWSKEALKEFDAVIISTNHSDINYKELAECCDCIIDTRNSMKDYATTPGQVWQA
ncbi:nucleotide sugar dehydrogenase [Aliifodinibius sp. S!AR15-10]|uniref:nucleotide sugar dehydrogenase n=1 Tax=Aliifodinibius sp. S!AR15-10 TaxID=2950437 RepID=UPI0028615A7B|nr:nucleotide sugar dehydrogenase [Aliifodinibius sp. S!AR15-10]MDR8391192.1 nucleotide sugar dehydrogenase [Aliifodinibius sp. S!AR15-10]